MCHTVMYNYNTTLTSNEYIQHLGGWIFHMRRMAYFLVPSLSLSIDKMMQNLHCRVTCTLFSSQGIALIITVLQIVHVPNLKVAFQIYLLHLIFWTCMEYGPTLKFAIWNIKIIKYGMILKNTTIGDYLFL